MDKYNKYNNSNNIINTAADQIPKINVLQEIIMKNSFKIKNIIILIFHLKLKILIYKSKIILINRRTMYYSF